jgi:lipoprotein NlpI
MNATFPFRGFMACLGAAIFLSAGCISQSTKPRVVFTQLSINGCPVHMILDTGAASTVLYSPAAKRAGLAFTSPQQTVVPGTFGVVTTMSDPARVSEGAQMFTTRLPVFTLPPLSRPPRGPAEDGVIGWPEVRGNILVFDSVHRLVRSVNQIPGYASAWLKLKLLPGSTLLLETPRINGRAQTILVDTGAPQGIQLPPARWKEARIANPRTPSITINHSNWSIGSFAARAFVADEINLGGIVLTDVTVENMPAPEVTWLNKTVPGAAVAGVIGLGALARMDLIVDGENGVAYLQPKPPHGGRQPAVSDNWTIAENVRLNCDNLFVRSGIDESSKRDFGGAIADYNHALELNPKNADAYANRALARLEEGDIVGAIADDTRAAELNPTNPDIHAALGFSRQISGDFSGAVAEYDKVIELNPDDSASVRLHRETLLQRLGRPSTDFATTVAGWKDGWLKNIGLFMAGQLDEKELLAAGPSRNQRCEAFYFIGMKHLLNGDRLGAREFFQESVATGVRQYTEYQFARVESERLEAAPEIIR